MPQTRPRPSKASPRWQGEVANAAALPPTGNRVADVRIAIDTFLTWIWNGSAWQNLPSPVGALAYKGTWDATNPPAGGSPTLADGVGTKGDYYVVSAAGVQDLGSGSLIFNPTDWVLYNGTVWEKADHTDQLLTVANYGALPGTGVVATTYTVVGDAYANYAWDGSKYIQIGAGQKRISDQIVSKYDDSLPAQYKHASGAAASTFERFQSGFDNPAGAGYAGASREWVAGDGGDAGGAGPSDGAPGADLLMRPGAGGAKAGAGNDGAVGNFVVWDGVTQFFKVGRTGLTTVRRTDLKAVPTDGIVLENPTPSDIVNTVQMGPRFRQRAHAWDTDDGVNRTVDWIQAILPATGNTVISTLKFGHSLDGAAYTYPMTLSNAGSLIILGHYAGLSLSTPSGNTSLILQANPFTIADSAIEAVTGTMTQSSGTFVGFLVKPTYNQSGTASASDLVVSRRETSVGSGPQLIMDLGTNTDGTYSTHTSVFKVANTGLTTITPGSAVTGLTITQANDAKGISIDSNASSSINSAINITCKYGLSITQDLGTGYAAYFYRNIAEAGAVPLVRVVDDHTSATQHAFSVRTDSSNVTTAAIEVIRNGLTNVSTDGILFTNTTHALVGEKVQMTPRARWHGEAWDDDDAVLRTVDWIQEILPASGNTVTSTLRIGHSLDGGAYTYPMTLSQGGSMTLSGWIVADTVTATGNDTTLRVQHRAFTVADSAVEMSTGTFTNFSGEAVAVEIKPTWNQSATASSTALKISTTESSIGSGTHYLIWAGIGATVKFSATNTGIVYAASSISTGAYFVGNVIVSSANNNTLIVQLRDFTVADSAVEMSTGTWTHSSGEGIAFEIAPIWNASGTAAETCLLINSTSTTVGSGVYNLILAKDDTAIKFSVNSDGGIYAPSYLITATVTSVGNDSTLIVNSRDYTAANSAVEMATGAWTNSSGLANAVAILPVYTQSGTASGTDLLVNRTENSVGSGAQLLADFQVATASKFSVSNVGTMIAGSSTATDHKFIGTSLRVWHAAEAAGKYIELYHSGAARAIINAPSGSFLGLDAGGFTGWNITTTVNLEPASLNARNIGGASKEVLACYFGEDRTTATAVSTSGIYFGLGQEVRFRWNMDATGYPAACLILGLEAVGTAAKDSIAISSAAVAGFNAITNVDGRDTYIYSQSALDNDKRGGDITIQPGLLHGTGRHGALNLNHGRFGTTAISAIVGHRGMFYLVEGAPGTADLLMCIMKAADNSYSAVQVAIG